MLFGPVRETTQAGCFSWSLILKITGALRHVIEVDPDLFFEPVARRKGDLDRNPSPFAK